MGSLLVGIRRSASPSNRRRRSARSSMRFSVEVVTVAGSSPRALQEHSVSGSYPRLRSNPRKASHDWKAYRMSWSPLASTFSWPRSVCLVAWRNSKLACMVSSVHSRHPSYIGGRCCCCVGPFGSTLGHRLGASSPGGGEMGVLSPPDHNCPYFALSPWSRCRPKA